MEGKVAVVTGGNGLLGAHIVKTLKQRGCEVIAADINISKNADDCLALDITDEDSVKGGVDYILKKYGKIDGWVNNAYPRTVDWGDKLEDIKIESWRRNVDMHLNGYFLCCQVVLNKMKSQGYGSLINMSSIYGLVGPDFSVYNNTEMTMPAAYSAIKGGINNLTRYLAAYYGPHQVRVNSVSPGGIFDNQPKQFVESFSNKVPLRRMGTPDDISPCIAFLLSDDARYITGQNILIDGGWTSI
ncbi:oxidoreductase [Mucilaginibacter sp. L3T2-6]|uniref:oxidoreductase n=1 Tax=Mucilaginibacter sp. L3T2-6 TaxID=3062491 RepID=UPI0026772FE8|nr:oxidoreductase [Mucilaginibacter sp. L3T2-6]MDO3642474.1 oxidoreductase [Mucilaginibacter sp. L3T2-6]MDV6215130.1 oxidoreductase [Mucilaginibacter sp. L3T2-6]